MEQNNQPQWSEVKKINFHHRVKRFYYKNLFRKIYTVVIIGLISINIFILIKNYSAADEIESPAITQNDGIKITFNLSGGYRVEDGSTGSKIVTFQTDSNNMVGTTNRRTPSRNDECEENGVMKKCMFDGWYLEDGNRWMGYATQDTNVYAKWLPFDDITITTGKFSFKIMDRNLGAKSTGNTSYNNNTNGYRYQRGNNYGFSTQNSRHENLNNRIYTEKASDRDGQPSTYYNGIWRRNNPRHNELKNINGLRGGGDETDTQTSRQGPCPVGYHVPSLNELLKLPIGTVPFSTWRESSSTAGYNSSYPIGTYRTSDSSGGQAKSVVHNAMYGIYYSNSNTTFGFTIRCYLDTQPATLTLYANNQKVESKKLRRYDTEILPKGPEMENARFIEREQEGSDKTFKMRSGIYITGDTKLNAKYKCNIGYIKNDDGTKCEKIRVEFNANGGKIGDKSIKIVESSVENDFIEYSHTPNITNEGIKTGDYDDTLDLSEVITITGASKLYIVINYGINGIYNSQYQHYYGDYLKVRKGDYPNGEYSLIEYLEGYNDNSENPLLTKEYDIDGNIVTFNFRSENSNTGPKYGYYAIIKGDTAIVMYPDDVFNNISEPTREGHKFLGRYFADNTEFNTGSVSTGEITYVHAKRECAEGYEDKGGDCIKKSGGTSGGGGGGSSNKTEPGNNAGGQTVNQTNSNTGDAISSGVNEKEPEGTGSNMQTGSQIDNPLIDNSNLTSGATVYPAKPDEEPENRTSIDSQQAEQASNKSTKGQTYTQEFQKAYEFAKGNGITTMSTIDQAQMNGKLTRIQMAKMLSYYAMNVLGQVPDTSKGIIKFKDVSNKLNNQYDNAVTLSYQLGIMGQNMPNNKFRPNDEVSRAEFATALSRLLYSTTDGEYESTSSYYIPHLTKLYNEGILNNANPKMKELRGYVMIMLMRSTK